MMMSDACRVHRAYVENRDAIGSLGLPVLDLSPMYLTDVVEKTDVRRASSLNVPYPRGRA